MNLMQMMKQAQNIQSRMKNAQDELGNIEVTGEAGNGTVIITMDGRCKFKSIKLSDETANLDTEMLEDVISTAIIKAEENASKIMEEKMKAVTGGINIPGLF